VPHERRIDLAARIIVMSASNCGRLAPEYALMSLSIRGGYVSSHSRARASSAHDSIWRSTATPIPLQSWD